MTEDLALIHRDDTPEAERFARLIIARGFRWAEVAQIEGLSLGDVLRRTATPDVQNNLNRLTTTGEASTGSAGRLEVLEFATKTMRDKSESMQVRLACAKLLLDHCKERTPKKLLSLRRAAFKQIANNIIDVVPSQ